VINIEVKGKDILAFLGDMRIAILVLIVPSVTSDPTYV